MPQLTVLTSWHLEKMETVPVNEERSYESELGLPEPGPCLPCCIPPLKLRCSQGKWGGYEHTIGIAEGFNAKAEPVDKRAQPCRATVGG